MVQQYQPNRPQVRNPAAIAEFEGGGEYAPRSIGAELVTSREAQEVQVAMAAAKRFPRDPITAYNRIINDCTRRSLAEKAMYEYPRGGTMVTGPSIHLARVLARSWGNLDSGFKVLDETESRSVVLTYCWDLETNYRETKVFDVPKVRQTKKGSYALTDPRDIYENIANQAARRERACILAVIPSDIVDAAIGQCQLTLASGDKVPLIDAVRELVRRFQEFHGVTPKMLEAFIGCKREAFSRQSVIRLRNVYNAIQDGTARVEQFFDMSLSAPEGTAREEPVQPVQAAAPAQTASPPASYADPVQAAPPPQNPPQDSSPGVQTRMGFGDLV